MSKDVPTYEPRTFIAGATVSWSKSLEDYPAGDGWLLKYALRGPDATGIDVTATADGDDFLITISSTSSDKTAGTYRLVGWVELGIEKYYLVDQQLVIKAKPAAGALDTRSDAEQVLAALITLSKTKASLIQGTYTIAGRQMQFESHTEILKAIGYWSGVVNSERRMKRVNEGGDFFPKINVRF